MQGKDDSRQDAVMQQVFILVNQLLKTNRQTRSLGIRTYKIVPLSQQSGVLEWCEGTIPLGNLSFPTPQCLTLCFTSSHETMFLRRLACQH